MSSSRYSVVPQDYDDYEGEYHDVDFEDVDVESRLSSFDEEPSIVSITVSRKVKPDGTIVRVKETFLSDGTSYQEETAVPRRKPAATGAGASSRIATSSSTNQTQQSRPYKTYKQSRKHSMEILQTHFMPDKPAPFVLNHKMSLPQSQDPKSRMMYYVCCRCTLILVSLLIVGALSIWFLLGDDTSTGFLETLQSFLHNFLR